MAGNEPRRPATRFGRSAGGDRRRAVASRFAAPVPNARPPSARDEVDPWRAYRQVHDEEHERDEEPELVELALREVAARREDDVLTTALRRDHREVAAREEQGERHQRQRHAAARPDVEE